MKTAVIYARYSSDSQTEQSIEGQLRVCEEYAAKNNIVVLDTYIDRAMTGTNDNRPDFQRMIRDSAKKTFGYVLVYKFDRFSRNKYETAMYKKQLKDNGTKVLSATEFIPDTPEGIIFESMLEGYAEYYSAELSQKIRRGNNESRRKNKPFVAINCAAFPKDLLQSELFGYADGAFTGAQRGGKPGLIEIADGGTLFLDEIAEMDYATQANLLRVVQERYIIRLGSHHPIAINCCIISATNKNLVDMIGKGLFREDLYYRLNVLSLNIPPLREHKCDIISLIHFFLNSSPAKRGNREISLSEHAKSLLESYSWPGNIRELRNFTERLLAMCPSHHIRSKDIQNLLSQDYNIAKAEAETASYSNDVKNIRHEAQMKEIREALQESKGNYGEAAKRLGISRTTLWRRMRGRTS